VKHRERSSRVRVMGVGRTEGFETEAGSVSIVELGAKVMSVRGGWGFDRSTG
jgi:hypothetical protein